MLCFFTVAASSKGLGAIVPTVGWFFIAYHLTVITVTFLKIATQFTLITFRKIQKHLGNPMHRSATKDIFSS